MLEIVIYIYALYIAIKIILSYFQIKHISLKLNNQAVLLDEEKYKKAGEYAIKKEKLSIVDSFIDIVMFVIWVSFGFSMIESYLIEQAIIVKAILFVMIFMAVGMIVSMPMEIYKSFILDKEYEFSKNLTIKTFILDTVKGIFLFIILAPLIVGAIAYFIDTVEYWWFYSFITLFAFLILVNIFYPVIRAKMFDKFSPLEDGELRNSIETLLNKVNFKSSGIFTVDASKRDSRLNAYFGGLGKTKRVVLFDTLVSKLSKNELLSVLGHELGHFKNGDIVKNIALMGVVLLATFFIVSKIPQELATQIGLSYGPHFIIMMFLFLSSVIFFAIMPIISMVSRHNEYKADEFGSQVGSNEDLANALIKLVTENLSFPHSHPFYIFFYYSHPPLLDRLKALGKDISSDNKTSS